MWTDELRYASTRVHRRRLVLGLALGVLAGGAAVAAALGVVPVAAIAVLAVAVGGSGWLLGSSAERALSHRSGSAPKSVHLPLSLEAEESPPDRQEVREARVGALGHFRVTAHTLVIETLLSTTGTRIEDLAWAYGIHDPGRRFIPLVPDAWLMLKFGNGAEITLPCFHRQVTPCLSAIRYFAGHVALGWDTSLADSWEADRAAFVASVQARLGRVSGPGGTA
jgi:hypothetical protein